MTRPRTVTTAPYVNGQQATQTPAASPTPVPAPAVVVVPQRPATPAAQTAATPVPTLTQTPAPVPVPTPFIALAPLQPARPLAAGKLRAQIAEAERALKTRVRPTAIANAFDFVTLAALDEDTGRVHLLT